VTLFFHIPAYISLLLCPFYKIHFHSASVHFQFHRNSRGRREETLSPSPISRGDSWPYSMSPRLGD